MFHQILPTFTPFSIFLLLVSTFTIFTTSYQCLLPFVIFYQFLYYFYQFPPQTNVYYFPSIFANFDITFTNFFSFSDWIKYVLFLFFLLELNRQNNSCRLYFSYWFFWNPFYIYPRSSNTEFCKKWITSDLIMSLKIQQ